MPPTPATPSGLPPHLLLLCYVVGFVILTILLAVSFKRILRISPTPLKVWFGGALSAFVGGFVEGCPIGSPVGAGAALADGQVHADFDGKHILIELAHVAAVPFFTGLADVRNYTKASPFPNVFQPSPVIVPLVVDPTK